MPLDPTTAAIAGGAVAANSLLNGFMQQRAAAYNQRMTEKNTFMNFELSQKAQRNAAANEVLGLRAAGLSPVLADGAQGMSVSAGSSGTASAPQVDAANALLLKSQLENMQAQTEKTKAEAKSTELQNDIVEGHNETLGKNMALFYRKLAENTTDEDWKKFYLEQADFADKGDFNSGNYDALIKYFDLQGKPEEAIQRKLDKKLSAWLSELRWNQASGKTLDDPFVKALGTLDARQSDLIAEQLSNAIATGKNIEKETELLGAKLTLTNEQIEQVKAAAEKLKNENVIKLIEDGEYGKALMAMLLTLFNGFAAKGPPL